MHIYNRYVSSDKPPLTRRAYLAVSGLAMTGTLTSLSGCQSKLLGESTTKTPTMTTEQENDWSNGSGGPPTTMGTTASQKPLTTLHIRGESPKNSYYDIIIDDPEPDMKGSENTSGNISEHTGCQGAFSTIKGSIRAGNTDTYRFHGCLTRVVIRGHITLDLNHESRDADDAQYGKVRITGNGTYYFQMTSTVSVSDNSIENNDRIYTDRNAAKGTAEKGSGREDDFRADGKFQQIRVKASYGDQILDHDYATIPCTNPVV